MAGMCRGGFSPWPPNSTPQFQSLCSADVYLNQALPHIVVPFFQNHPYLRIFQHATPHTANVRMNLLAPFSWTGLASWLSWHEPDWTGVGWTEQKELSVWRLHCEWSGASTQCRMEHQTPNIFSDTLKHHETQLPSLHWLLRDSHAVLMVAVTLWQWVWILFFFLHLRQTTAHEPLLNCWRIQQIYASKWIRNVK